MAATIVRATLALNALIATLAEGTVVGGNPMGNFFGQMEGLPVRRMEYIDSARGAAVVLALLSHSFLQFASDFDSLRLLTRTATPAFLVIFGIMVEMVYLRKMRNGTERATIVKRLLSRAITCYVVFFAICAAAFATGKLEFYEALGAVLYLDDGRFGLILRIYAVLFVIVALMLTWAVRVGSTAFLAVAAAAFGLKYALDAIGLPGVYLLQQLFGHAEGFGPAVLPSLSLVAFGVCLGEMITGRRSPWRVAVILAGSLVVVLADVLDAGLRVVVHDFVMQYRWINHPSYFAIGIMSSAAWLLLFFLLWSRPMPDRLSTGLALLGRQTFFVYGFGNVMLNLLPTWEGTQAIGLPLTATFLVALFALAFDRQREHSRVDRLLFGLPGAFVRLYASLLGRLIQRVSLAMPTAFG